MKSAKLVPECHVWWHLARGVVLGLFMWEVANNLGVNERTLYQWRRRRGIVKIPGK